MSPNRLLPAALVLSAAGFVAIIQTEGFTSKAVQPLPGDKWTYGFGSTTTPSGAPVKSSDTIQPPAAVAKVYMDVQKYEGAVKECIHVPLTQTEYDLYVKFSYNVGPSAFCTSGMAKALNAKDYVQACKEFLKWKFFKKKDCSDPANGCRGLWTSRQASYNLCMAEQK